MIENENEFAFPSDLDHYGVRPSRGMTLRDWFAGQALAGIGTWTPGSYYVDLCEGSTKLARARWAYEQADAMLKARGLS